MNKVYESDSIYLFEIEVNRLIGFHNQTSTKIQIKFKIDKIMDKPKKDVPFIKPISRKNIMRYLTRFKLQKKQHKIQPRTFSNSLGLSIRRLESTKSVENKTPIINSNVKARLESNLQYLLQNQNNLVKRIKQPESYVSLAVNKINASKRYGKSETVINRAKNDENQTKSSASCSDPRIRSNENGVVLSVPHTQMSRKDYTQVSKSFQSNDNSSFAFDTIQNQVRAEFGNAKLASSGDFFNKPENKNRTDNQMDWFSDEQPSVSSRNNPSKDSMRFISKQLNVNNSFFDLSTDKNHIRNGYKNKSNKSISPPTDPFDDFDPNIFDPEQRNKQKRHTNIQTKMSKCHYNSHRLISKSYEDSISFVDRATNKSTVQKLRVIKSSISRIGESPFMEKMVIQKVKRSY